MREQNVGKCVRCGKERNLCKGTNAPSKRNVCFGCLSEQQWVDAISGRALNLSVDGIVDSLVRLERCGREFIVRCGSRTRLFHSEIAAKEEADGLRTLVREAIEMARR